MSAGLGWLVGGWLGSHVAGILVGTGLGAVAAFYHLVKATEPPPRT